MRQEVIDAFLKCQSVFVLCGNNVEEVSIYSIDRKTYERGGYYFSANVGGRESVKDSEIILSKKEALSIAKGRIEKELDEL